VLLACLAACVGVCILLAEIAPAERPPIRQPFRPPLRHRSLYEQEGGVADGYPPVNAAGHGPYGDERDISTNWKYQYGASTWSGVFARRGWVKRHSTGQRKIDVEADIEIYCSMTSNSSYYFHVGNLGTVTEEDLTAYPTGTLSTNAGMYVGLKLSAMGNINQNSFETDGAGLTGRIFDAMVGTVDVLGRDISDEAFDLKILLSWDGGNTYNRPVYYGASPDGYIDDTLWWLINNAVPGEYDLKWKINLLPEAYQADGNYHFVSEIVAAPFL